MTSRQRASPIRSSTAIDVAVGTLAVGVGGRLGGQGHGAEHDHLAVVLGEQQAGGALGAGAS